MIFITGDIHGKYDIKKLNTGCFPIQKELTRDDHLIICGDFGMVWDGSAEELYWRKWIEDKPWTTLWIDGNHENFDMLYQFPEEEWQGGRIHRISEHVIHLCRGYVFNIEGLKVFAFGGAESHDRESRVLGESIWEQEMPTAEEMDRGISSLNAAENSVDLIITHSLPTSIQNCIFSFGEYAANELTDYFDEISAVTDYRLWFSGHYHRSLAFDDRHNLIYNDIVKLNDNGFEKVHTERFMEVT